MNKKELINLIVESQKERLDKEVDEQFGNIPEHILNIVKNDTDENFKRVKLSNFINELQDYVYTKGLKDGLEINNILNKGSN